MAKTKVETAETSNGWLIGGIVGIGIASALLTLRKKRREFDLNDKIVLISGGSRGLGLVLARQFAGAGAKLAICSRDEAELQRAQTELESNGAEVFTATCDVRNRDDVESFVEKVVERFGQIDVLVNNAGVIQVAPLENQVQADFEEAMQTHFWGAFFMMQATLPHLKKLGAGRIVNISSIGGKVAIPHLAPYSASKFALVGLSSAMRNELLKENIFVTTVCPGLMRTGSHVNAVFKGQNEAEYAWFSAGNATPLSSISAERAAAQIIEAAKKGDAELIISIQAQILAKMNQLFPETTSEILGLVNRLLPSAGGIGEKRASGLESRPATPSTLTKVIDEAAEGNNELKPRESLG